MGLKKIARNWRNCDRCALRIARRSVVFGERFGSGEGPRALVIGGALSAGDEGEGRPFTGPNGHMLRQEYLKACGVGRSFLTTVCACRPPRNRKPTRDEARACSPRLQQVIEAFNPEIILIVGKVSKEIRVFSGEIPQLVVCHPSEVWKAGWPGAKAKKLLAEQAEAIKGMLAELNDDFELEIAVVDIVAGAYVWEGVQMQDFVVDEATGKLTGGIPRKPSKRRKKCD